MNDFSSILLILRFAPWIVIVTKSDCEMLSESFAWSDDLDLPCARYPGSCWLSRDILSVSDCEQICVEFNNICLSYSYGWSSGLCTISNMSTGILPAGYKELRPSQDTSFFQKSTGKIRDLFEGWPQFTLANPVSYKTVLANVTLDACAEDCTRNRYFRCQSFDYSTSYRMCYLSDVRSVSDGGGLKYLDTLDHYEYRQNVWPSTVSIPFEYRGRVLASPGYPYTPISFCSYVTSVWIPPGHRALLNLTFIDFDRNVCNDMEEGIFIYTMDNQLHRRLTDRICRQSLPRNYVMTNRKFFQIYTYITNSSVQYEATYEFELLEVRAGNNRSNGNSSSNATFCGDYSCGELVDLCLGIPCANGQHVRGDGICLCLCNTGYTGQYCESDVDECLSDVCSGTDCMNTLGGYRCVCPQCQFGLCVYTENIPICQCFPGFSGHNCSEELNECENNICRHGNCTDYVNGVECECDEGYTGRYCDVQIIHPCDGDPCRCGACVVVGDDFRCECPRTRTGNQCEMLEEYYDNLLGTDDLTKTFCNVSLCEIKLRTECHIGFLNYFRYIKRSYANISIISIHINKNIEIKVSFACNTERKLGTETKCEVAIAFLKTDLMSELVLLNITCDGEDCSNSSLQIISLVHIWNISTTDVATCLPVFMSSVGNTIHISQTEGFYNPEHLVDILYKLTRSDDDTVQNCALNLIIQIQFLSCWNVSSACDGVDIMVCTYNANITQSTAGTTPYSLTTLTTSKNLCSPKDCIHGYCESEKAPYCTCDSKFRGQRCDVRICNDIDCDNCESTNLPTCLCTGRYQGDNCNSTTIKCEDKYCFNGNCRKNASGKSYCECHRGFSGIQCENKVRGCDVSTCVHGNCTMHTYELTHCVCDPGFTGIHCEFIELNCDVKTCIHGRCTTDIYGFPRCDCYSGYTGSRCENTSSCDVISCVHGNCAENGSCLCSFGYSGPHCELKVPGVTDEGGEDKPGIFDDYVLWGVVGLIVVLLVATITTVACIKVKKTRGEFSFRHIHINEDGEVSPRMVDSRDIHVHADLRRGFYPQIEVSQSDGSSDVMRSPDAFRRYSIPDYGSLHNASFSQSSGSHHYDIPPPPVDEHVCRPTDIQTILRYAVPQQDHSSASSTQRYTGGVSQIISGAAVGNSEV